MLTTSQRERCRSLAQALDRGDVAAYKRAEDSLSVEEKGEVWDQRAHVKAQAARAAKAAEVSPQSKVSKTARIETELRDLDYWAADPEPVDDDDGEPCEACNGSGRDDDGGVCSVCDGTGRVPAGDDAKKEDEDDESIEDD